MSKLSANMVKKIYIFISLFFLATGCSFYQITSEETTFDSYSPKTSSTEVTYYEDIFSHHKVIGYVSVNVEKIQKKEEILSKLKEEAAKMGGDAITNIRVSHPENKNKFFNIFKNAKIRETYTADVVVGNKDSAK